MVQGQPVSGFDGVWLRIVALQGQTFRQRRGKPFTYVISGGSVAPSTTNRLLARSQFARAFDRAPLGGPGQLQDLQGPSYLFAILTDPRIAADGPVPAGQAGTAEKPGIHGNQPGRMDSPQSPGVEVADWPSAPGPGMKRAGGLPPAAVLVDIDPRGALLVVTCSARKERGGQAPSAVSPASLWPEAQTLSAARTRVLAGAQADTAAVLPAWRRYTGTFYRDAHDALADVAATGQLVILSGGYGVLSALEPIGWYDKQLRLQDWPPGLLESALLAAARHATGRTVVAFAPTTTEYARLLRRVRWRDAQVTAYLVTVTGVSSGAMVKTPRRLAEAFSAFWNARHDAYPPGAVVEHLS